MNLVAHTVMIAWMPLVMLMFSCALPRRAAAAAFLYGWLFLPQASYSLRGIPDINKATVVSLGVILAILVFDAERVLRFRPALADIPMFVWCLCPFASALHNGLGIYDGASAVLDELFRWGTPYLVGRLYITNLDEVRELAVAVFVAGLVYVPFCLYEIRMSPQLHKMVYGFHQHQFVQAFRMGSWRPMVFMQHGLMVGFWMATCSLVGVYLWASGACRSVLGLPIGWAVCVVTITALLCKSLGALLLLASGLATLFAAGLLSSRVPLFLLMAVAPAYMAARMTTSRGVEFAVALVEARFGTDRAQSLSTRFANETVLVAIALRQPWLGYGRWGRSRRYDGLGRDDTITDGLWIITLGRTGMVGVAALCAVFLLPPLRLMIGTPMGLLKHPRAAAATVLTLVLLLFLIDSLLNAMVNPNFAVIAGALTGLRPPVAATTSAPLM